MITIKIFFLNLWSFSDGILKGRKKNSLERILEVGLYLNVSRHQNKKLNSQPFNNWGHTKLWVGEQKSIKSLPSKHRNRDTHIQESMGIQTQIFKILVVFKIRSKISNFIWFNLNPSPQPRHIIPSLFCGGRGRRLGREACREIIN